MNCRLLHLALVLLAVSVLSAGASAPSPRYFAVRLVSGPAWDAAKPFHEQAGASEHSVNIARLRREGVLVLGGRLGELGLMVLRVPDEAAARAQFESDPTIAAGVFTLRIDPYLPFAHGSTAWLTSPEAQVLRAYYEAFNRHDADAVAALCAPDIQWLSVTGERASVETDSREKLHAWLVADFAKHPTARSELLSLEQTGPHLSVRERATWQKPDGTRGSQQALAIYEVRDGLVRRAWYFPSARDPAPPAAK